MTVTYTPATGFVGMDSFSSGLDALVSAPASYKVQLINVSGAVVTIEVNMAGTAAVR